MRRSSVKEYTEAMRSRYKTATKAQKSKLLDEFVEITGYHRKSAVRALSVKPSAVKGRRGRPARYGAETREALRAVWEASERLCGKRLAPFLGELADRMVAHGELSVSAEVRKQLGKVSASTIDRLMRPHKRRELGYRFGTTKPGSLLKAAIPIRTFAEWDEDRPGFLEVDLVAHCGESTEGFYLNTLTAVDIATGWVECRAVWGKGQQRVGGAIHELSRLLPFPLVGLDSDNGSEFINHHLYRYCESKGITFTRSRPYRKNDNAHVEQKNWSVVRRLVGYDRYASRDAHKRLGRVYTLLRQYVNYFQPVMKLVSKSRNGARVRKVYDEAKTPYQRLLEYDALSAEDKLKMQRTYESLNPVRLRAQIDKALEDLWKAAQATHSR